MNKIEHKDTPFEYYDRYTSNYLQDVLDNCLCQVWNRQIVEEILEERGELMNV